MQKKTALLFLFISTLIFALNTSRVYASDTDRSVREQIDEFKASTKCAEVSVVVVDGDETQIFGDATGLYQIGSMTKAFTGLAVNKLIADGKLSRDDSISDILPGFTAYYGGEPCDIKIANLLDQTSGYTNKESVYPAATKDMTLMEWVESISGRELNSRPGSEYAYSNVNYNLLGAVIEQVSGLSYREYLETEILLPLGLTDTYVQVLGDPIDLVRGSRLGYRHAFEYEIPVAPGRIPAGYFYSNATDMARWISIWLGTADIPEQYQDLVSTVKATLINPGDYDSGWESFENGTIGHSGGTPNYSSRIVFSDNDRIGVCVLANLNVAASTDSLCNSIFASCTKSGDHGLITDVWTVFDQIFTAVTVIGIAFMIMPVFLKKRTVLYVTEGVLTVLLVSLCIVMPLVFGAGLTDIMFIWAPLSFAGGLITLALSIVFTAVKLWMMRKNEN